MENVINDIKVSPMEMRVYRILAKGGKHSAMDLAVKCHTTKAVNRINDMRNRGIRIEDEWRQTEDGATRYKVYFLPKAKQK